ncbi:hypothetical protein [Thiofilum flexile]|uniref:hypothetical protein n=1 Tax=Thiofilum flexile TaxID=125627 RepID=UPI000372263D|nr:hypothetical protein [Thiofilum flexile]
MTTPIHVNRCPPVPSSTHLPPEPLVTPTPVNDKSFAKSNLMGAIGSKNWSRRFYYHLAQLIENRIAQLLPRHTYDPKPFKTQQGLSGLKVCGLADRVEHTFDPWNPLPNQDLIFLGLDQDYQQAVVSITIGGDTTPVNHENGQLVARYLNFGSLRYIEGELNLADGSKIPLQVHIVKAL